MITIFFFYGLAFIVMGIVIFMMPKRNDLLNLSDDLWLVGLFGLTHGLNEWIGFFILRGGPFDAPMLKAIGSLILPLSFIFLVLFGVRVISRDKPRFKWLKFLWIICLTVWALTYIQNKDFLVSGIVARYFIYIPGAFLTAFALNLRFSKSDKKQLPKVVLISTQVAIFTFILYGVFSGLLVPKADFLLASIVNYPNFTNLIRVPVQLFRMSCAIILSVCFFGITGLFYYKGGKAKLRGGIKRKITLLICSAVLIIMTIGITLGYILGGNLLRTTVGEEHRKMAYLLAGSIAEMIDEEMEQIKAFSTDKDWKIALKESNLKYKTMESESIQHFFMDMDKRWVEGGLDSPLIKEYLENEVSIGLRELLEEEKDIVEIFITDEAGGLVASSGKTSDFYQADEEWWQEVFHGGNGKVFIGDIEFDESSNVWSLTIAVPIREKTGDVIGICKAVVDASIFFEPLERFKIGKTGHAVLVNEEGYIVFHQGVKPLSMRFYREEDFEKLLRSKSKWMIADKPHIHRERIFIAFAEISHPLLLERGINWGVFIDQDAKEVFKPLSTLIFQMILITGLLIIILMPIGFIFGGIFTRPIRKLSNATEKIAKGDLDYQIEVKTGDEIEGFANSFKDMITSIKDKQKELSERKAYVESIISSMIDTLIVINPDGRIKGVNKATFDLLGYKEEELIGQPVEKIFAVPEETPLKGTRLKELIEEGSMYNIDVAYVAKSGEKIPVNFNASILRQISCPKLDKPIDDCPEFKKKGIHCENVTGVVSIARDMREMKRLEAQLIRSEKLAAIGELAAGVAHEINNPLNVISGNAEMLSKESQDQEVKRVTKVIMEQVKRTAAITDRLLQFSRKKEPKIESLDVNKIIDNTLPLLEIQTKYKHIKVIKKFYLHLPKITGDFIQLQEVFFNMMLNAVQAMPKGGELRIMTSTTDITKFGKRKTDIFKLGSKAVLIEFEDTGEGIPEKKLEKIFDPFFSTKEGGTGLGLSICHGIIEAHQGTIEVQSTVGKGTTFIIQLPVQTEKGVQNG